MLSSSSRRLNWNPFKTQLFCLACHCCPSICKSALSNHFHDLNIFFLHTQAKEEVAPKSVSIYGNICHQRQPGGRLNFEMQPAGNLQKMGKPQLGQDYSFSRKALEKAVCKCSSGLCWLVTEFS